MLRSLISTSLSAAALLLLSLSPIFAQAEHEHSHEEGHEGHAHAEVVAYQLADWHEMHFKDVKKAAQHLKTVKEMGCEVKETKHAGHIDIVYRCTGWKELTLGSHKLAVQWLGWMKGAGFETHHADVAERFMHGDETIQLRLTDWETVHLTGPEMKSAREFTATLQEIGCSVKSHAHGDHADVSYRCPTWATIHVPDDAAADQWQEWLKSHGFETKHAH